ncbi:MAG: LysM peptidoglycan-binding domain-containing protein [Polyangiales bacterium]
MPRRTSITAGVCLAACTHVAVLARAEAPVYATTWSQEALEGVEEVRESPELRTLRLAEEQLFGQGPTDPPVGFDPDCVEGAGVDPPPAKLERPEGTIDLAFLKNLKLPSVPVRWDRRVLEYLVFFKDDPRGRELAAAWLARRERYGAMVRRALGEHSLPDDVLYVAMIESGFDPLAHSAADAWGMWQFLAEPAAHYGLRVDHWTDERLDPERATYAAARFMRDLFERFGSWELSFAAYNMGYGGLLRAIRKYNTNDYWTLSHLEAGLPFETALYVSKITAMAIVGHNPQRFGFGKVVSEKALKLAKVDVAPGTELVQVARAAGLPLEQLRALNPHLRLARVPPGEPTANVYLPRDALVRFTQAWAKQPTAQLPVAYVLRLGETLDELAKRTGATPQKLRELNELEPDAVVKPGFALLLPPGAKPTSHLVEPLVASVPARAFRYEGRRQLFYRVASEDTSGSIARFFDVDVDELTLWNALDPAAVLQPGMLLQLFVRSEIDLSQAVVYEPDEVRILHAGSDAFFAHHELQRGRVRVRYRVQPGDTLGTLAQRFQLSAGSIGRINAFPTNRSLIAGEQLILYAPADQLAALEKKKGVIERLGSSNEVVTTRDSAAPKSTELAANDEARAEPELPEEKGRPLAEPKLEGPAAPPAKKARAQVAAPTRPLDKARKK